LDKRFQSEEARIRRAYMRYDTHASERAKRDLANPGNRIIERERDLWLGRLVARLGLPKGERRALEVGCGSGAILRSLVKLGADPTCLVGVDILEDRIDLARSQNTKIRFVHTPVGGLPFPDSSFDLAITFTLFSSILDVPLATTVANEITRVLKPDGAVVWYDNRFPNPFNPDVKGLTKAEIKRLFPGCRLTLRSITVLPPLVRRLGRAASVLYPLLAAAPFLRARYIGVIRPRPSASS